ncbi:MAG: hypothetical protein V3V96_06060, partial [Acidiferrobacterales bacterium]
MRQGGAWPGACVAAHWWWESRRLSKATKKPASTSTFLAIARSFQVALLSCAQIGRQAVQRADQIGNGSKRRGLTPSGSSGALQALANDVGLRTPAVARFDLDLGYERLGQSYGKSFHTISVLRCCRECKTNLELTTSTFVGAGPPRFYLPVEPEQPYESYGQLIINVKQFREIDNLVSELEPWVTENFPEAQIPIRKFGVGPSNTWKFD